MLCRPKRFAAVKGDRQSVRAELGIEGRKVYTYVGSFGGWYLTDEMIDLFAAARERDPNSFTLILTQRDKEKISNLLTERGFSANDFFVGSVKPSEIARYLDASDVAVSFIKACYSKQSSSPTKIAEYLACGLPVISNRGIGDLDELIEDNKVGVMVDDFSRDSYLQAISGIHKLGDVRELCRQTVAREFDLEDVGGKRYRAIYEKLLLKA
ncbi:MAG: glycosyltransferase [Chloracidobacterium sp.]|nr:glycosyltransferase [Chloracidobacterium sp.]